MSKIQQEAITELTTGRRSDKRYIGTLERDNKRKEAENMRLVQELSACRKECGQLKNSELKTGLQISDLRLQVYNFQKMVYYTSQVTTWKENGDDS